MLGTHVHITQFVDHGQFDRAIQFYHTYLVNKEATYSTHDGKLVGPVEMLQYSYPVFHTLGMDLLSG